MTAHAPALHDTAPDELAAPADRDRHDNRTITRAFRPRPKRLSHSRELSGLADGQIDAAVHEYEDCAERFDNAMHLLSAVEILARADRLGDASALADRALPLMPTGNDRRSFLHEVGVANAYQQLDWSDVEKRTRAWINQCGPDRRRLWTLVTALYNQFDRIAAWRVSQEDGDLKPETPIEARLWIALHAEYERTSTTLSQILALTERFPGDVDVRNSAVDAFFRMGNDKGDIASDELARWHALIQDHANASTQDDSFIAIGVPEDDQGIIETFRPFLEPQSLRMQEWIRNVRRGWPYGMLALVAGRPYTMALVHRAAGFLPIETIDPRLLDLEGDAARLALDSTVLMDLSVLATAWYIRERWPQLLAVFRRIEITSESRMDASMAAASLYPRSSETLGWDATTGRPVIHESDSDELDRLEEHVGWIDEVASTLSVRPATGEADLPRPDVDTAWLSTLAAARADGRSLWADDVGLRSVAKEQGVRTFGTVSLLQSLVAHGRMSATDLEAALHSLREEYCVDLPFDPVWIVD